jgi:hypothetical protein
MNETTSKKKGNKTLLEFPKSKQQSQQKICISKIMFGMSIEHGCQRVFITTQPYLDQNLSQPIYLNA